MTSCTWAASFEAADISAMQIYYEVLVPRLFTPWARARSSTASSYDTARRSSTSPAVRDL
jgi:hypothetical protein